MTIFWLKCYQSNLQNWFVLYKKNHLTTTSYKISRKLTNDFRENFSNNKMPKSPLKGADYVNDHFLSDNPLHIMEQMNPKKQRRPNGFSKCCDEDFHTYPNQILHELMLKKGIPPEYKTVAWDIIRSVICQWWLCNFVYD